MVTLALALALAAQLVGSGGVNVDGAARLVNRFDLS